MSQLLDLEVELTSLPSDAQSEAIAGITLHCDALNVQQEGGVLSSPLTQSERDDLHWYLEEYWKWPFEGFAQRGSTIEKLLPEMGKRLYQAVFGQAEAKNIIQQWRANMTGEHQISIVSTDPKALSLPWELLHDEQGFLVLLPFYRSLDRSSYWELLHDEQGFLVMQTDPPISIVRRIAQGEQQAILATRFKKPLRVLMVTARPVDEEYVDARTIARELLDALQDQIEAGNIELEFLRPPTMDELTNRLSDTKRPIHILHFDGHGMFGKGPGNAENNEARGRLYFEDDHGKAERVEASAIAEMLRYGGVRLAVLNACRSAMIGEREVFSSAAVQFIQGGVDAVVAMSANVLVVSAAHYVKAFYSTLAAGISAQAAHEQAQRALQEEPFRHPLQRRLGEAGIPVVMLDWWLPNFYQQHPFALQPMKPARRRKQSQVSSSRLSSTMPAEPRYTFSGRSYELLQIERALVRKRCVVISGFGGVGKTALVREAADWLTRTGMYHGACFVSFEHGGDAALLLSTLGNFLEINDGHYCPHDPEATLVILGPILKKKHILVIVDNLESILPGGDASLEDTARKQLWDVLLKLADQDAGMLLTSRNTELGDERLAREYQVDYLELKGLAPDDAYALATHVLRDLGIDLAHVPYADLLDLLSQLDYHPLAIQLVLPALRDLPLAAVQVDFATLLPRFVDDRETGRNKSLLASLDYSLQRLRDEQRALLPRLALFEGGALDNSVLDVTEIPQDQWGELRQALEQAALITQEIIHPEMKARFQHFHPVLTPYLRSLPGADDAVLRERYINNYFVLATFLNSRDKEYPDRIRAMAQHELPNLQHALRLLLNTGDVGLITAVADSLITFLDFFGRWRERDALRLRVLEAIRPASAQGSGMLTWVTYWQEKSLGEQELEKGDWQAATRRFQALLFAIEMLPEGEELGLHSLAHATTLQRLARCLKDSGQSDSSLERLHEALAITDELRAKEPRNQDLLRQRGSLLADSGDILRHQGQYVQAKQAYEDALQIAGQQEDIRNQAVIQMQLGTLALAQKDYAGALNQYMQAGKHFHDLGEQAMEATVWYQMGMASSDLALNIHSYRVAQAGQSPPGLPGIEVEQQILVEAEQSYRESLRLSELLGDAVSAAKTCNQLAILTERTGRYTEAKGWYKRALELVEKISPGSPLHVAGLTNLATLLTSEAYPDRMAQIAEARGYAEEALKLAEKLDTTSETWTLYRTLATIAGLEGRSEDAQHYHDLDCESFAAFPGNRDYVNHQYGQFIANIVATAKGDMQARTQVESVLAYLEADEKMRPVAAAIRGIWAGERVWYALVRDVDSHNALIVLRVLETLQAN